MVGLIKGCDDAADLPQSVRELRAAFADDARIRISGAPYHMLEWSEKAAWTDETKKRLRDARKQRAQAEKSLAIVYSVNA